MIVHKIMQVHTPEIDREFRFEILVTFSSIGLMTDACHDASKSKFLLLLLLLVAVKVLLFSLKININYYHNYFLLVSLLSLSSLTLCRRRQKTHLCARWLRLKPAGRPIKVYLYLVFFSIAPFSFLLPCCLLYCLFLLFVIQLCLILMCCA